MALFKKRQTSIEVLSYAVSAFVRGDEAEFGRLAQTLDRYEPKDVYGALLVFGMELRAMDVTDEQITEGITVMAPDGEPARTAFRDFALGILSGDQSTGIEATRTLHTDERFTAEQEGELVALAITTAGAIAAKQGYDPLA